jgi:hypothetical protein
MTVRRLFAIVMTLLVMAGSRAASAQGTIAGEKTLNLVYIAWTGEAPLFPDGHAAGAKAISWINETWQKASYGKTWTKGHGWGPYFVPKRTVSTADALSRLLGEVRALAVERGDAWPSDAGAITGWVTPRIQMHSAACCGGFVVNSGAKMEHEYGHAIGFPHARALSSVGTTTTIIGYGPFDVMGQGGYGINVQMRKRAGWVDVPGTPSTRTVTATGRYSLESANNVEPRGPIGLTLCDNTYFMELRQERLLVYRNLGADAWALQDLDPTAKTDWELDVGQTYALPTCTEAVTAVRKTKTDAVVTVQDTAEAKR